MASIILVLSRAGPMSGAHKSAPDQTVRKDAFWLAKRSKGRVAAAPWAALKNSKLDWVVNSRKIGEKRHREGLQDSLWDDCFSVQKILWRLSKEFMAEFIENLGIFWWICRTENLICWGVLHIHNLKHKQCKKWWYYLSSNPNSPIE